MIDFHMHSTFSDGMDSPQRLAEQAAALGLRAIALTDHDAVGGVVHAAEACHEYGVELIPALEISAQPKSPRGHCHILGYGIDPRHPTLRALLKLQVDARRSRAGQVIDRLRENGLDVRLERLNEIAGDSEVIRPHIAQLIVEAGGAEEINQAMRQWLKPGAPAHVKWDKVSEQAAIEAIHAAGGLAFLAHPKLMRLPDDGTMEARVVEMIEMGLDGIEVYNGCHKPEDIERAEAIASKYELLRSGGSDYHGAGRGYALGCMNVPDEIYDEIMAALV